MPRFEKLVWVLSSTLIVRVFVPAEGGNLKGSNWDLEVASGEGTLTSLFSEEDDNVYKEVAEGEEWLLAFAQENADISNNDFDYDEDPEFPGNDADDEDPEFPGKDDDEDPEFPFGNDDDGEDPESGNDYEDGDPDFPQNDDDDDDDPELPGNDDEDEDPELPWYDTLYAKEGEENEWQLDFSEENALISQDQNDEKDPFYSESDDHVGEMLEHAQLLTIHELWNSKVIDHVYCVCRHGFQNAISVGYKYIGRLGKCYHGRESGSVAVYRLVHIGGTGDHFYTTSKNEANHAIRHLKYNLEGVMCYVPTSGGIPVYRSYNPAGDHFYTTNWARMRDAMKHGWKYEGVAFRIFPA